MDKLIRQNSNAPTDKLIYASEHAMFRNRKYSILEDSVYTLEAPNEIIKQLLRDLCLDTKIKYCAQCMKYGYHSVFHQARFLDHCFIHENTKLEYRCDCKGSYVLTRNSNDVLIFQCPICKKEIHEASLNEGIMGAWDKSNIIPLIHKWESGLQKYKSKRKFFLLDINAKNSDYYRYLPEYKLSPRHKRILKDYFIYGNSNVVEYFRERAEVHNDNEERLNASTAIHNYIIDNYSRNEIKNNYQTITAGRISVYDKEKCNYKLVSLYFTLRYLQGSFMDRLYHNIDQCYSEEFYFEERTSQNPLNSFIEEELYLRCRIKIEEHINVYNYLYKAYVISLFKFIYSCFLYDQPVKAPDIPEAYIKLSAWRFPVFLVVQEENGDIVIY